jgi:hypothetical protein
MSVTYVPIDGERVSRAWFPLLHDLRVAGVAFNVNEGHRTRERQQELIDEKGLWSPSNPTGAAAVSDNAPHIWTGRPDHAIDFDNAAGVVAAARKRGVTLRQTVMPHEPWHVVPDLDDLRAYRERRKKRMAGLRHRAASARKGVKRWTRKLKARVAAVRKWAI